MLPLPVATFVIVHGAFGGGWEWRPVATLLRGRGHEVFTPTLTGMGERAHLLAPGVDLDTHIADVLGVLMAERLERVVLCGQSYGGVVVTGVADRRAELLAQLIYVDALLPEDGEAVLDLVPRESYPDIWHEADEIANRQPVPVSPDELNSIPEPERSYVARLTDHPLASITQPLRLKGGASRVPTSYVRCVSDDPLSRAIESSAARARQRPWQYSELAGPHDIHWFQPETLADVLQSFVATTAATP
jgi:pimeloyl-ACP methyl ester carboxylesterase